MTRKKTKTRLFKSFFFITLGFFLGVGVIWPGIISEKGRKCFFKIIKDGRDGNVSLETIFSITPNHLLKIHNTKNKYKKILLIGDFCYRKF